MGEVINLVLIVKAPQKVSKDNNRFDGGRINRAIDNASNVLVMQVVDTIYFFDFDKFTITGKIKVSSKRTAFVFADTKTLYAAGYYEGDEDNYVIEEINIGNTVTTTFVLKWEIKTMATHNINKLSISAAGNELLIYDAVIGSWVADLSSNKIKKQFKTEQNFAPYSYLPNGNYLALSGKKEKQLIMAELGSKNYLPLKNLNPFLKTTRIYVQWNIRLPARLHQVKCYCITKTILWFLMRLIFL